MLGKCFGELGVKSEDVIISNKLAWVRKPLRTVEPTFEPGVWKDIKHDAEQKISYEGTIECWEKGCELLGQDYKPLLVSVHDPDEYLKGASSKNEREKRFKDIIDAYRALIELKEQGKTRAVGVGAKDWQVIKQISEKIELDWVMFANSLTIMKHPPLLIEFIESLSQKGVGIINSAVFHGGFLVGSNFFDYK
jgi:D-threo-aldose 1-dehydrogenase